MRELTVRIKFTSPCLGNVKSFRTFKSKGKRRKRTLFLMPRSPSGKVTFLPTWWQANMKKAAEVLCRYQKDVSEIRFSPEVDGQPRQLPDGAYRRYHESDRYSPHEAFLADDVVGVSCLVPSSIDDESMWRLMELAGKYYGISPYRPGDYGFFTVESIKQRGGPIRSSAKADSPMTTVPKE